MLLPRVITSIFGAPLLLGAGYVGGAALALFVGLVAVTGVLELHALQGAGRSVRVPPVDVGLVGALAFVAAAAVPGAGGGTLDPLGTMSVVTLFATVYALVRCAFDGRGDPMGRAALGLLSATYVGGLLSALVLVRGEGGWAWFALVIGATWALDIGAYAGGRAFGRTSLVPSLSPNKTVEGAVAGLVCAAAAAFLLSLLFGRPPIVWALIGSLAGVVGQVGDLVESAIKRHAGVKDSGRILPGHGGILDRFDSLMFIAPTVYFAFRLLGG